VVVQGDIWWADMDEPIGSAPGYRRPVVVVQGDTFNQSGIETVVCVALTSNPRLALSPGNVLLPARITGLPRDSVANVTQISTLDRTELLEHVGTLPRSHLELVLAGIEVLLGRRSSSVRR